MDNAPQQALTTTNVDEKLNLRQRLFVNAYLANGGNALDAYRQAGYTTADDTSATARSLARSVRTNSNVAAAIARRAGEALAALGFNDDRILLEAVHIATFDPRDIGTLVDGVWTLKDSEDWTDAAAAAVASITTTTYKGATTTTVKFHSKDAAMTFVGKARNMFAAHERASGEGQADAIAALLRDGARRVKVTDVPASLPEPSSIIEGEVTGESSVPTT